MSTSTRTISLFCPSLPNDVDNFTFSTTTSYDNILSDIRAALGATSAIWPYDARKQPIEDFAMLKERQNVLIATDYFELPLDIARDVRVVQRGGAERAWMALETTEQRVHIATLQQADLSTPPMYLTLPFARVQTHIAASSNARLPSEADSSIAKYTAVMQDNWALPLDAVLGFQGMVMPDGEMKTWEKGLLAILAMFSEATVEQGDLIGGLIIEAVKRRVLKEQTRSGGRRGSMVVTVKDVMGVGKELYQRALG